jgi:hypothetical protein
LENNLDEFSTEILKSLSTNRNAIHILAENQDKINWNNLSKNSSIFKDISTKEQIEQARNRYKSLRINDLTNQTQMFFINPNSVYNNSIKQSVKQVLDLDFVNFNLPKIVSNDAKEYNKMCNNVLNVVKNKKLCNDSINEEYINLQLKSENTLLVILLANQLNNTKPNGFAILTYHSLENEIEIDILCSTINRGGSYLIDITNYISKQLTNYGILINFIRLKAIGPAVPFYIKQNFKCEDENKKETNICKLKYNNMLYDVDIHDLPNRLKEGWKCDNTDELCLFKKSLYGGKHTKKR